MVRESSHIVAHDLAVSSMKASADLESKRVDPQQEQRTA
jgi:hypothetical protein